MENNPDFYSYLFARLPLALTFASGYIVYLLLATTRLTDVFVCWSLQRSRGNLKLFLAYVVGSATLLSFFIPNAITVLALLPFIKTIERDLVSQHNDRRLTTALTLSVIYGANIGGMGSLVGSPANLLLIGALDLYGVPGREQVSFMNWFLWSVPLVIVFSTIAWALIATLGVSRNAPRIATSLDEPERCSRLSTDQEGAGLLFVFFLVFWISEGIAREVWHPFIRYEASVCAGFFALFVYLSFLKPLGNLDAPLLRFKHLVSGLPKRGLFFLAIVVFIIPVVHVFQIDKHAATVFSDFVRPGASVFFVFFATTSIVIFLTEILSNTVVSTAFFPIAFFTSGAYNVPPLILMIAVSVASTCAFMTPIATPCNALAFGEMKRISLGRMLVLGGILNIIGALLITFWLQFVIPVVYFG